ncbi:hypothetical protein ABPG77_000606 [Micractinium sp. CCAP 211/92]
MDRWDESIYADDEVEEEDREATREQLIFLIDASEPMLAPCDVRKKRLRRSKAGGEGGDPAGPAGMEEGSGEAQAEDELDDEFEGKSWLEAAVHVAAAVMRQKVIAASGDRMAVMFYNTRESAKGEDETGGSFPHSWLLQKLEPPSATDISALEAFELPVFERDIGRAPPGTSKGQAMKSALWRTASMLQEGSKQGRARTLTRVLVFTRDQEPFRRYDRGVDPSQEWTRVHGHLRTLREHGAALELYPMLGPGDPPFSLVPFWRAVLQLVRGGQGDAGEEADEAEQVGHIGDLTRFVRSKAHPKRSLASFQWRLGPRDDDPHLAVKLYALTLPQKLPALKRVNGANGAEVRAETAELNVYTGGTIEKADVRYFFPKDSKSTLPKTFVTLDELDTLRGKNSVGMLLLGFKPLSCLKEYHQIRSSNFLYPDDKKQPGSATAFIALHEAMQRSEQLAVCRLASTRARTPQLVALLPAEELLYEDGSQASPPGFHIIYLPYADDVRSPETNTDFTGAERAQPSEEAIAAGEAVCAALSLPEFYAGAVMNPSLQRHYEVLECKALGVQEPPVEEAVEGDETQPAIDEAEPADPDQPERGTLGDLIQAFKDAVGVVDDEPKRAAGKRKAAVPIDEAGVEALGVEDKAAQGTLKSLTVDQLKTWLKARGCPVSGKKDELVARIINKLGL